MWTPHSGRPPWVAEIRTGVGKATACLCENLPKLPGTN